MTPNTRTTIAPRFDYQLSTNHTLVARFEYGWNSRDNQGIGGYRLPPPYAQTGYNSTRQQSEPDADRDLDRQSQDRQRDALPVLAQL